jgi:hypothetical protein
VVVADRPRSESGHGIYFRLGDGEGRIDLGLTHAEGGNTQPKNDIRHVYLENDAVYATNGTKLAEFSTSGTLINFSDATVVYDSSATGNSDAWIWDCASYGGEPAVVYVELNSTTDHVWRYDKWDGSAWQDNEVVSAGEQIADPSFSDEGY